jgi:hypothetical protein
MTKIKIQEQIEQTSSTYASGRRGFILSRGFHRRRNFLLVTMKRFVTMFVALRWTYVCTYVLITLRHHVAT